MNNKLLDDARAAGFHIDNNKHKELSASNIFLIELLTKFAELQIPDGYKLVPIEPTKPAHILKTFWERAMQGYKFILKNGPPINTESD